MKTKNSFFLPNYLVPRLQDIIFVSAFYLIRVLGTNLFRDGDPGRHITVGKYMIESGRILTIFMPLISGGCVEVGEDGLVADGLQLLDRIENNKPSHVQATPSTWKTVLTAGWKGSQDICLIASGEALSRELAEQLLSRCRALWDLYGPTETTVYSSAYRVTSAPTEPMQIGHPLPNTQMYILDKQYQAMPIGAVADLYIAGDGLAVGYWHKAELTNERFLANPFRANERMYWTGDLAKYLPDGSIVYLGRLDDQVKIHGVRVELGEVESTLRTWKAYAMRLPLHGRMNAAICNWSRM